MSGSETPVVGTAAAPGTPPLTPPPPPASPGPPEDDTLRSTLGLARSLALLIALLAGVLFLVALTIAVIRAALGFGLLGDFSGAAYCFVSAVVNYLIWKELPPIRALVAQQRYAAARDRLLVWTILGLLFFVLEGVVLLLAEVRLDSLARPPLVAVPGGPSPAGCPRCGGPLTWIAEYGRNYCYRCGQYV